ncbi:L-glyceraldehyde 3-phosphate reductase [Aeromonas sp. BIGb0405]|jgi:L-glyceraldehyde 3-phosphate reductase|uniref:aldo/keto reductase n=1 Tax=unclassified Aeromonas TaxID=257493 RepID=UPI00216A3842|nr:MULTISPECIES: aldo/keto reductase [unclassified Aeromonas]MCS3457076.1 L-glyceraldehyde 3-phosphate reductase [Aeromonas sp. BIGb0405]MCS3460733.1 L-glyceraldehyde 3-phosphate reductase [Aeromonas sp. BIGb0445]
MDQPYQANPARYQQQPYRAVGRHGLRLPAIALGLWHNFGAEAAPQQMSAMVRQAFDLGITHFDLANNYGPPPGSAETSFGRLLKQDLAAHRDELIISTKAGYVMWDGPYGDGGSAKYLFASLHQSLRRLGLDYVDIFYHHRPDSHTPLEETCQALALMVRQGKALYVGLSNYPAELARQAAIRLAELGTPCLVNQLKYSLFQREIEEQTLPVCREQGMGVVAFSPLAGGLLSDRYLAGIPADSRAASPSPFLKPDQLTAEKLARIRALHTLAEERGQSLSQLALQWVLRDAVVSSALIGASRPEQIVSAVQALAQPPLDTAWQQRILTALD